MSIRSFLFYSRERASNSAQSLLSSLTGITPGDLFPLLFTILFSRLSPGPPLQATGTRVAPRGRTDMSGRCTGCTWEGRVYTMVGMGGIYHGGYGGYIASLLCWVYSLPTMLGTPSSLLCWVHLLPFPGWVNTFNVLPGWVNTFNVLPGWVYLRVCSRAGIPQGVFPGWLTPLMPD